MIIWQVHVQFLHTVRTRPVSLPNFMLGHPKLDRALHENLYQKLAKMLIVLFIFMQRFN
jgi:hypothetical protein